MKPLIALLVVALTVTGFVRDGAAEIIFPQAIRFTLDLALSTAEIASAELTLDWGGHDPVVVSVDVGQAIRDTETGASLSYDWRIPVDDPPPLFGDIRYRWSLTAGDGSTGAFDGTLTFSDPRVDWVRLDSDDAFRVAAPRAQTLLVESLPEVRALLETNTGRNIVANLLIYPFEPGCTPGEEPDTQIARAPSGATVFCDVGIADAVLAGYRVLLLRPELTAESQIVGTLVREAYAPLWQDKAVPDWFIDGLAQFYAPSLKNGLLPPVQQAARDGTLLALRDLQTAQNTALWRAQSYGMILFIADKIGFQGLLDLARVDADDFDSAYERVMGAPLSALIPAWQQWIFSRQAEAVYGITPYQPPTPTPTFTPTASSTPTASATATLMPSMTPTFTTTPRGARTRMPVATVAPSNTPTLRPATRTPRPAGSLPTVTPPPTALQTAVAQPGVQAGVITFLILLLGLLVFLFIRLGNRR